MYCEKCGAQIDDDSVFCQKCGKKQTDTFNTSMEDNSESSETGKIEVGTMLYVIKPDINLPQVGYKVRVTKKVIVDGKEQIIAQGPYKPDGTPVSKVRTMYAIDLSKFSTSPPSQEVVQKGNTNRRRSMFLMISAAFTIVIIIGLIYFGFSSGGNGNKISSDPHAYCRFEKTISINDPFFQIYEGWQTAKPNAYGNIRIFYSDEFGYHFKGHDGN